MRLARRVGIAVAVLALLAIGALAIPVHVWRTGERPAPPLPVVDGGPAVTMPARVWVDADAACGHGRTTDPDDCHALLLLARSPGITIVGVSTVHGNAPLDATDRTARDLMAALQRDGVSPPPVHRGAAAPIAPGAAPDGAPAHDALRQALAAGPLTVVALGPLTNVAAALHNRPDLQANVGRLVLVMGRRRGHLFHPSEGEGIGAMLFGHGPLFSDFNFEKDRAAAAAVLALGLPTTLVPYDVAREISLTGNDLARMEAAGGAAAWVATRSRDWLAFWREDVGRDGFYPFDLLAAAYVVSPELLDCAAAQAWIGADDRLWSLFEPYIALLVGLPQEVPQGLAADAPVAYCVRVDPRLHDVLMLRLSEPPASGRLLQ